MKGKKYIECPKDKELGLISDNTRKMSHLLISVLVNKKIINQKVLHEVNKIILLVLNKKFT